ncbi:MAG: ATP-binding cassette domain-containing protein, partial [Caldimonas sp.]
MSATGTARERRSPAHLRVEGLSAGYGGFLAVRDVTFEAAPGLTVIVGANGAGKTTLLRAISGLIARQGRMLLDGVEIAADASTASLVGRGLVLVPEGRHLFARMSVLENLEVGAWLVPAA